LLNAALATAILHFICIYYMYNIYEIYYLIAVYKPEAANTV